MLIFDLQGNAWKAYWGDAKTHGFSPQHLTFDVAGVPTLRLKPDRAKPLKIVVTNISPISYSASAGTPSEADLEVITGLKSFLTFAGTGLQGLVQTLSHSAALGVLSAPIAEIGLPTGLTSFAIHREPTEKPKADRCSVVPEPPKYRDLLEITTTRLTQVAAVGQATVALSEGLEALESRRARFITAAQRAEDGHDVSRGDLDAAVPDLTPAFDALQKAASELRNGAMQIAACQPLLAAYGAVIGSSQNLIADLTERVAKTKGCTHEKLAAALFESASTLQKLDDTKGCEARFKETFKEHQDLMKPLVERLADSKQTDERLWQGIDKAQASRRDVLAGASTLQRQIVRSLRHTWNGQLIRMLAVTRQNPTLKWSKIQTHSIVMKADSPYVKELSLAHGAEEKREYKLESATGQILGYGLGLIYTPLHESTWTAATLPGTTTKVITETGRETRAGDLAAFISYRFMEHWPHRSLVKPTFDVGVGLTSDRPAFFVGIGAEVFRAARVGFGWAPQRVRMLADGQTVNTTVVSETADIKTVNRFDTSHYYVSFTFALDSLSLFSKQ